MRDTTKLVALEIVLDATSSTSSSRRFAGLAIRATPTIRLKSTTAGTTLLASELNGLVGMYRLRKSNGSRSSSSVALKNEAFELDGNIRGNSSTAPIATAQSSARMTPSLKPSVFA